MAKILHIYWEENNFCRLEYGYNKRFVEWLSKGVRPLSYRRYDNDTGHWYVHLKRLAQTVAMARRHFEHVDYSDLPEMLQISLVKQLEGLKSNVTTIGSKVVGPHAVLFVLETAPWEVVRAAYKALALLAHPDQGGSEEDFRRIQKAYEELKETLKG